MITIFLTSTEIKEVLSILNNGKREVRDFLESYEGEAVSGFRYYIAGPVASGKSTLLQQMRCFNTLEEWTTSPPREMYLAFDKLTDEQEELVDDFVCSEIKEKNIRMTNTEIGFHFMDRAPLDLYAFSEDDDDRKKKTQNLQRKALNDRSLQRGEVVFVTASGPCLAKRNLSRGRPSADSGDAEYLQKQGDVLKDIYNPNLVINSDEKTAGEIGQLVTRFALLGDYNPIDLQGILRKYEA